MDKLKNMTLKKSFFLIVSITAMTVILLSAAAVKSCTGKHNQITLSHAFMTNGTLIYPENGRYIMDADGTDENFREYTSIELLMLFLGAAGMAILCFCKPRYHGF